MSKFHTPVIIEQRALGGGRWLQLHSPELAAQCRPGHYLLLRCADVGSTDPLLRRTLFVAGADRVAGLLQLFFMPEERGLQWLARQAAGAELDIWGPLGQPFELEPRTGNLLLAGQGLALAALLFLATSAVSRGVAVVLMAAASSSDLLPPPYLLPPEVEYQGIAGNVTDLLVPTPGQRAGQRLAASAILWADQLCAAVPDQLLRPLSDAVAAQRLRWQRGFAQVALGGSLPCGVGACLSCLVETRDGWRTRCKDGPVFDLKTLRF